MDSESQMASKMILDLLEENLNKNEIIYVGDATNDIMPFLSILTSCFW